MGATKRQLEKEEEYRGIAFDVLTMIGAIKTCDFHDDFYYATYLLDDSSIYAMATAKVKKEYNQMNIDFQLFHDSIKEIMDEAADGADSCPYCDKIDKE